MTPHDRELGSLSAKLESEVHHRRNMRMVLDSLVADYHELRTELDKLRIIIRTTLSVLAVTIAALAWLIEIALRT